uniref:Uncharacterized protein n=1 Tax=Polysiphonia sertularioides TaxID=945028 RepID=A0A1Z1MFM8_9FLOR|nr:hypothetical protein [Polysiphonia sertularioides]
MIENYDNISANLFLLKDFHLFSNDLTINRKVRNLYRDPKNKKKFVITNSTEGQIPSNLKEYVCSIKLSLPSNNEIEQEVRQFLRVTNINLLNYDNLIIKAYGGFSLNKIRISLLNLIQNDLDINYILSKIFKEKKKIIDNIERLK